MSRHPNNRELLKEIIIVAGPMMISSATETINMFVDRKFLSHLGESELSASFFGGITSYVLQTLFIGVTAYISPLVAQYLGAEKKEKCASAAFQGVFFLIAFVPLVFLMTPIVNQFFQSVGHEPEMAFYEFRYFRIVFAGGIFMIARNILTGFFLGIGKTGNVMFANIIGMVINIPANFLLIFGIGVFPELGVEGAAYGTVIGSAAGFLILFALYLSPKYNARYQTRRSRRFDRTLFFKLLRFGGPSGIELFLTILAFNLFIQLMGTYGLDVAAGFTITFNWDIVSFVPLLGLGQAISSLVGKRLGGGKVEEARRVTFLSLRIALAYSLSMGVLFLSMTPQLVAVFSGSFNNPEVDRLAILMIRLATFYLISDAVNISFVGALRGAGDTRWIMITVVTIHWLFFIAVYLMVRNGLSPIYCWVGFIVKIGIMAAIGGARFFSGAWKKISVVR